MPLPSTSRSGRRPHCSDANSVPVRPKPVATSSQMSSTSCSRHAAPSARERRRGRRAACPPRPARAARRPPPRARARARRPSRRRSSKHVGIVEAGRAQHREAQRIEQVGAEAAVADRERADGVAVVRAAEGEERACGRRRPGSPSTGTRSSAPARPPPRRRTRRGSAGRRPARRAPAPRPARRRRGCRCRASWSARRGRAGRGARRRARGRGGRAC